jgi:hypothetical protein
MLVGLSFILTSCQTFTQKKKTLVQSKRSPSNEQMDFSRSLMCRLLGTLEEGSVRKFSEKLIQYKDLTYTDKDGYKGVYFDIFYVGGFSVYSNDLKSYVIKSVAEDLPELHKKKSFSFGELGKLKLDLSMSIGTHSGAMINVKDFTLECSRATEKP